MRVSRRPSNPAPSPHRRRDSADAFFPDPGEGPAVVPDDLAEELAEEFLESATTGQEQGEEAHERLVDEELGGPFVITSRRTEFAYGSDEAAPGVTDLEPFPTAGAVSDGAAASDQEEEEEEEEED